MTATLIWAEAVSEFQLWRVEYEKISDGVGSGDAWVDDGDGIIVDVAFYGSSVTAGRDLCCVSASESDHGKGKSAQVLAIDMW